MPRGGPGRGGGRKPKVTPDWREGTTPVPKHFQELERRYGLEVAQELYLLYSSDVRAYQRSGRDQKLVRRAAEKATLTAKQQAQNDEEWTQFLVESE